MSIPINKCREILVKTSGAMTDTEIEQLRNAFVVLSDLAIDSYLERKSSQTVKLLPNTK